MTVVKEERPEGIGQGEHQVLPGTIGQAVILVSYPLIGGLFAAGGAKTALATEADFFRMRAIGIGAGMGGMPHNFQPASQHFDNILDNGRTYGLGARRKIPPPGTTGLEQFFDGANEAHGWLFERG